MFKRPIAIGLSPNTELEDAREALKMICTPWRWKNGSAVRKVEKWFEEYFNVASAVSFNSGRSAMYAILQAFEVGEEDEVIVQAFTCVAVPDPILWAGAKAVYADIDESLNIDPGILEKYITKKTKAIIVQHTFGIPAKIDLIKKIAQKHSLLLIEDCCHSLGSTFRGQKVGTLGDAAFFSFGRDKVVSSVFGGTAIISQKSKVKSQKLRKFQEKLPYPNYFWIVQQLLHPIMFAILLPLYAVGIGKLLLFVLQKLQLLSFPVYPEEKSGGRPVIFPAKYPNALADLALVQLAKLDRYNRKRREIADYYFNELKLHRDIQLPPEVDGAIYLRFNILTKKVEKLLSVSRKNGILLGNWYRSIIDPKGVDFQKISYTPDLCPKAEEAAMLSVNLPTYPKLKEKELKQIIDLLGE